MIEDLLEERNAQDIVELFLTLDENPIRITRMGTSWPGHRRRALKIKEIASSG